MLPSSASLRTRTGCLQCKSPIHEEGFFINKCSNGPGRKRRKKCDETRPCCAGCIRNALRCEWPLGEKNQPVDGRRRLQQRRRAITIDSEVRLSPPVGVTVMMPAPFQLQEHSYLHHYFTSTILPHLVLYTSLDQTHMLRLALESPTLMGAMISIGGMHLPSSVRWSYSSAYYCAVQSYLYTIKSLQGSLADASEAGCDDRILATVILLSVFEACRFDTTPNVTPHVTASGLLLTQRQWKPRSEGPAVVFDRICIESFLYHASLMMLFDPLLDALTGTRCELSLPLYLLDLGRGQGQGQEQELQPPPAQTILPVSYKFFLLISDVTKLSRLSWPLVDVEIRTWRDLEHQLSHWAVLIHNSADDVSLDLCYLAIQILLHKTNPDISSVERNLQISNCLQKGLTKIPLVDIHRHPPVYLLWPVAVLGSVAVTHEERNVVRNSTSLLVASKQGGHAAWVQNRMDRIWALTSRSISPDLGLEPGLVGLQFLLDGV